MNCLEVYRRKLVREINLEFRSILNEPDEEPVHDFRVGVKRLTALYLFLQSVDRGIKAKKILKPYRGLFKVIGKVRDLHIAENLLLQLGTSKIELNKLRKPEGPYYKSFKSIVNDQNISGIRVPTIPSLSISDRSILAGKKLYLRGLLSNICTIEKRMTQKEWHKKRIILKRYHHTLDAFQFCPGNQLNEEELKQMRMLENLLGDWHDRVTSLELISTQSLSGVEEKKRELMKQERILLSAARIYLYKYSSWHSISL